MKKLPFCIFLLSFAASGQSQGTGASVTTVAVNSDTRVSLQRKIELNLDSRSEEIIVPIEGNVDRFELNISSSVTTGKLKIEVYDPSGINQGTFSMGRQLDAEKSERVHGNIKKSLEAPQSGNWRVNIYPTETTGFITIQTAAFFY